MARWDWKWLLLLFVAAGFLTGLGGEYPLNDDWIFASGVRAVLEEGRLAYSGYAAPNLLLQLAWGVLWCEIGGGFSFVLLRLSVLVLSGLGLFAMYRLALAVSGEERIAFGAGLVLLFNPLYYHLSFTFLTDVPFAALALLSLWQYACFFKRGRGRHRWAGAVLAVLAFLVRQPGLMIWVAAEAVIFLGQANKRKAGALFLAHFAGAAALYVLVEYVLKAQFEEGYHRPQEALVFSSPLSWLRLFAQRCVMSLFYVGLLLLPYLPGVAAKALAERWWKRAWFMGLIVFNLLLALGLWHVQGRAFPFSGNTVYNLGLGAPVLADWQYAGKYPPPQWPLPVVFFLGLVVQLYSCLLLKLMAEGAWRCLRSWSCRPMDAVVVLFGGLHALIVYIWSFIDRYVLMLSVAGVYFLARAGAPLGRLNWAGTVLLLAVGGYAVGGTHDYLAWNEAVREKKEALLGQGIERTAITAGYAQDGWDMGGGKGGASYLMAWGEIPGYRAVDSIAYQRWLPGRGRVYVLAREE